MKMSFQLPWRRPAAALGAAEKKAATAFSALTIQGEARWSGRSYGALAREGFMKNPVAHRAIRLISETAASVPLLLYQGGDELSEHPLLALLHRPNGRAAGTDFFEALYGHLLLSGNAFIEPVVLGDEVRELHLLRPDRMRVIEGADGWPEAYEYRVGGRMSRYPAESDGVTLLHMRLFHPLDDHLGFSPLAAAQMALDLHNASAVWNKALLDNSARPSGALLYQPKEGGNLTEEQYERLKQELEEGYSGPARAGRPLLLEGGLDWKAMGLSPRDMDFTGARNGAARDIALAVGVPPMMLGIPGDNTYSNYQEANRAFYRLTVIPLIARTVAHLMSWLGPLYGSDLRLEADLDQVSGLSGERDALWARIGAADFLSEEEKRAAVGY
ncbi:phage portal protein [Martelella alba]|uniref:Phage portal protein n=1 Tax=Martelella alba TaxID=2590451 RepID=A0A506U7J3_9HYPH|nr:phage portal protein [Martelella alba]TPW29448.1 phage portal protein [Martelella alba]